MGTLPHSLSSGREGRLCLRHYQGESIKFEADFAIKRY